jgi:hypothetical protein
MRDEVLALCELSNDLLYYKIPKDKLLYYISESLAIGKKSANQWKGQSIRKLCEEKNIQIHYIRESKKTYGVSFRAQVEMDKKQTTIFIYEGSIRELAKNSGLHQEKPLSYDAALDIHLAHEFFHYLEYISDKFVSEQLEQIVTIRLPFITKKAYINRCSEIAAHAFTKELLGLEHLPNLYDYYYLINSGQMKQVDFEQMIKKKEELLNLLW